jgi:hypothetical protein
MSVEAGASALVTSARLASFSYPAAIASIVDRASASRILSARLLASAARAIHCVEVGGSSMPCRVAHPMPAAKSHLSERPTTRPSRLARIDPARAVHLDHPNHGSLPPLPVAENTWFWTRLA